MASQSQNLLEIVVKAVDDKKGNEIVSLDMQGISVMTDYNIITHGNNERQISAIARGVMESVEKHGYEVKRVEGKDSNRWILIDLNDVIVHVFHVEERDFYQLEKLWSEAPLVNISKWIND